MKKRIALLFAMEAEAQPLIQALNLQQADFGDPALPFMHYQGAFGNCIDLLLSWNGKDKRYGVDNIGTEPAALNAYVTIRNFQPDLLINAGTAGGFVEKGAQIGDVYLSTEAFRFHDRRIAIPGFNQYGIGHYPVSSLPEMAVNLGLKEGVVTTSNSLDYTDKDLIMMRQNNGSIKEMEAAGIGWVAHLLKVPFFAIKAVTDFVDSPYSTEEQFLKNLSLASRNLRTRTLLVLDYLSKHLSAW